eukprot:4208310-Pyramimonas_sp.AAC.1
MELARGSNASHNISKLEPTMEASGCLPRQSPEAGSSSEFFGSAVDRFGRLERFPSDSREDHLDARAQGAPGHLADRPRGHLQPGLEGLQPPRLHARRVGGL